MAEVLRDLQAAIGQVPRTRACRRGQAPARGTAEDPGRPPPRPATARRHPADRVGTPGGRRGTIDRVRGVDLHRSRVREPRTPIVPKGQTLRKAWRSLGSPTPDTALWGHSPDVPVWRDGDRTNERGRFVNTDCGTLRLLNEAVLGRWRTPSVHCRLISFEHGTLFSALFSA